MHRNIKPSNVLDNMNGEVKLLGFGIAKLLDDDTRSDGARSERVDPRLVYRWRRVLEKVGLLQLSVFGEQRLQIGVESGILRVERREPRAAGSAAIECCVDTQAERAPHQR